MAKDSSGKNIDVNPPVDISGKVTNIKTKRVNRRSMFISKIKRRALKHVWLVRFGLIALVLVGIYLIVLLVSSAIGKTQIGNYVGLVRDFIFTPQGKVETIAGRSNILILGKGGKGHEAPDLTDTIIFASVKHPTPENPSSVSLISLSRDIWIPELRAKLNSAYYWGNQKQTKGGLILAKATIEQIVGTHVQYVVVIDFSGFKNIIDTLGRVEVEVDRSFVDKKYPIAGREDDDCGGSDPEFLCRYETVEFKKGVQVMNGDTALKFARSRNAEGEEGTDFARAARQEKVLNAMRNKMLSREIIMNPKKVLSVIRVIGSSIETDIEPEAAAILVRRILDAKDNVSSKVLPEDLLFNPPISPRYDNLYVFIPEAGDWSEVHDWVKCILENGDCI